MKPAPAIEPDAVSEPVARALDTLILVAAASFVLSVMAVLVTVLAAEGQVHAIAHASLPGLMALVIVIRGAHVLVRHPRPRDDAWSRAHEVSRFDARLAKGLSFAVPLAWLIGTGSILWRHGTEIHGMAAVIGVWMPLLGFLWIVAAFAWIDACRDRIGAGVDEADRRFRAYWRDVGQAR